MRAHFHLVAPLSATLDPTRAEITNKWVLELRKTDGSQTEHTPAVSGPIGLVQRLISSKPITIPTYLVDLEPAIAGDFDLRVNLRRSYHHVVRFQGGAAFAAADAAVAVIVTIDRVSL